MLGHPLLVLAGLFDLGLGVYILWRMRRAMASAAFWTAIAVELTSLMAAVVGMLIKGYSITLMLVIFGLAATAIVLSTWGRVEVFFNVIAAPETWTSRSANIVAIRFCAAALVLALAAIPLLIRLG